MTDNRNSGKEAENFVYRLFFERGFNVLSYPNEWYDLTISKNEKTEYIEVKSCNLIVSNGKGRNNKTNYKHGRFDFTAKKNRILQRKKDILYCFVLLVEEKKILLGFSRANTIKAKRYVTLKEIFFNRRLKKLEYVESLFEK